MQSPQHDDPDQMFAALLAAERARLVRLCNSLAGDGVRWARS